MGFFLSISQRENNQKLEDRITKMVKRYFSLVKELQQGLVRREIIKQSIRSMGSIGANYREANESLSRADLLYRLKVVRKEAKETLYWLELLDECCSESMKAEMSSIKDECRQIFKIFCKMINNIEKRLN